MPSYIIKPEPDEDLYVLWSDVVEAPVIIGTRAEVTRVLQSWGRPAEAERDRFDRADRHGSSAMWPKTDRPIYGWDDAAGFIAEQRGVLRRGDLTVYARLRLANDPAAFELLQPFEE